MVRTVKIYTLVLALITSACLVFAFEANNRADSASRQKAAWRPRYPSGARHAQRAAAESRGRPREQAAREALQQGRRGRPASRRRKAKAIAPSALAAERASAAARTTYV